MTDLHTDGNEVGGLLADFLAADITAALRRCQSCHAEHPIAAWAAKNDKKIAAFVEECRRGPAMEAELAQIEKKGMPTGLDVTHPLSGEKVPVWVGNYVLMTYGEGAVMGVPAGARSC